MNMEIWKFDIYTYTDGIANTGYTRLLVTLLIMLNIISLVANFGHCQPDETQRRLLPIMTSLVITHHLCQDDSDADDGEVVVDQVRYARKYHREDVPKGIDESKKFTYEHDGNIVCTIRMDAFGYRSDLFNYDYRRYASKRYERFHDRI